MTFYKYIFIAVSLLIINSCTTEFGNNCIKGEGEVEKRVVEIEAITKIDLGLNGDVFLQEGPQFIEIEAPSDIIDKILNESEVGSERWIIEINDCYNGDPIKVWATLPQFVALDISGSGDISSLDTLRNVDKLNLEIDGSGDFNLQIAEAEALDVEIKGSGSINIDAGDVLDHSYTIKGSGDINTDFNEGTICTIDIDGSGDVTLMGFVDQFRINIDGQGDVHAENLCSQTCIIDSNGSGDCRVKVDESLDIKIDGSGDVCYKGSPTINSDISGSGNISTCN